MIRFEHIFFLKIAPRIIALNSLQSSSSNYSKEFFRRTSKVFSMASFIDFCKDFFSWFYPIPPNISKTKSNDSPYSFSNAIPESIQYFSDDFSNGSKYFKISKYFFNYFPRTVLRISYVFLPQIFPISARNLQLNFFKYPFRNNQLIHSKILPRINPRMLQTFFWGIPKKFFLRITT